VGRDVSCGAAHREDRLTLGGSCSVALGKVAAGEHKGGQRHRDNARVKPTPCSIALELMVAGTPSGVPGGKPNAGSGLNSAATMSPTP
jgi:hypothetical protein